MGSAPEQTLRGWRLWKLIKGVWRCRVTIQSALLIWTFRMSSFHCLLICRWDMQPPLRSGVCCKENVKNINAISDHSGQTLVIADLVVTRLPFILLSCLGERGACRGSKQCSAQGRQVDGWGEISKYSIRREHLMTRWPCLWASWWRALGAKVQRLAAIGGSTSAGSSGRWCGWVGNLSFSFVLFVVVVE